MVRVLQNIFGSHLGIAAAVSVVILTGVAVSKSISMFQNNAEATTYIAPEDTASIPSNDAQQQELMLYGLATNSGSVSQSATDTIAMIGPVITAQLAGQYAGIQDNGTYSPSAMIQAAESVASNIRASISYKTFVASDIKTDSDTSFSRMLTYRADLRDALAPLLDNTTPELDLFARYIDTGDTEYLKQLNAAANNYRKAIANVAAVTAPRDAVGYQRGILNAMSQFTATIDGLSLHGSDALASAALLRTFNTAEEGMYSAFNALASYYVQKKS